MSCCCSVDPNDPEDPGYPSPDPPGVCGDQFRITWPTINCTGGGTPFPGGSQVVYIRGENSALCSFGSQNFPSFPDSGAMVSVFLMKGGPETDLPDAVSITWRGSDGAGTFCEGNGGVLCQRESNTTSWTLIGAGLLFDVTEVTITFSLD
jgi:hypothetical protein